MIKRQFILSFLILFIVGGFVSQADLFANEVSLTEKETFRQHLIANNGLTETVMAFSSTRLRNIETFENFINDEYVKKQLSKWGISAHQIKTAVRTLSNPELDYLLQQSLKVRTDFFGGAEEGGSKKGDIAGYVVLGSMVAAIVVWEVLDLWIVPNKVPLSF